MEQTKVGMKKPRRSGNLSTLYEEVANNSVECKCNFSPFEHSNSTNVSNDSLDINCTSIVPEDDSDVCCDGLSSQTQEEQLIEDRKFIEEGQETKENDASTGAEVEIEENIEEFFENNAEDNIKVIEEFNPNVVENCVKVEEELDSVEEFKEEMSLTPEIVNKLKRRLEQYREHKKIFENFDLSFEQSEDMFEIKKHIEKSKVKQSKNKVNNDLCVELDKVKLELLNRTKQLEKATQLLDMMKRGLHDRGAYIKILVEDNKKLREEVKLAMIERKALWERFTSDIILETEGTELSVVNPSNQE